MLTIHSNYFESFKKAVLLLPFDIVIKKRTRMWSYCFTSAHSLTKIFFTESTSIHRYLYFLQFEIKRPVTDSIPNPIYVSLMLDQGKLFCFLLNYPWTWKTEVKGYSVLFFFSLMSKYQLKYLKTYIAN